MLLLLGKVLFEEVLFEEVLLEPGCSPTYRR
jgi:hypothetical protein